MRHRESFVDDLAEPRGEDCGMRVVAGWQYDRFVCSTHGTNCTVGCSDLRRFLSPGSIYKRDAEGIVLRKTSVVVGECESRDVDTRKFSTTGLRTPNKWTSREIIGLVLLGAVAEAMISFFTTVPLPLL